MWEKHRGFLIFRRMMNNQKNRSNIDEEIDGHMGFCLQYVRGVISRLCGSSDGAENIRYLKGDVNQRVECGRHVITWRPDKSWQGHQVSNATARVCAWAESSPSNYLAVELVYPYTVKWYASEESLPEGIESDQYRKDVLLMRKINHPDGGVWRMGSPHYELERSSAYEALHRVDLNNDYWMGVFEITQWQWNLIVGNRPSNFNGDQWSARPVGPGRELPSIRVRRSPSPKAQIPL